MTVPEHQFKISPISEEEGGGFLVTFPDLPGCMSDGGTISEAVINAADAEKAYIAAKRDWDTEDAEKGIKEKSGRLNIRIPKSVHYQLEVQAKHENVSLNTLIVSYLSGAVKKAQSNLY